MPSTLALTAPHLADAEAEDSVLPIEARGLVFEVRGQRLIDGIDLTIAAGGRTVVMGPNGAGKSVLLRLLHGLLAPTAGTVRAGGRPLAPAVIRRQAMVFQRPVLLRRSVAANVRYALAVRGVPRAEREGRLAAVLEAARLTHLARNPARVLSGGEQQRLAIARALGTRPEVLFLDEPTASLDPTSTRAVEDLVLQADRAGAKVVLVTHDVGQARRLADEVVFLHRGRVVEQQRAERFFAGPATDAARDYLEGRLPL
jgi:tungstate transport system ATP-binding protein